MICEICGKEIIGEAYKVIVEGTELIVCREDSRYGRLVGRINLMQESRRIPAPKREENQKKVFGIVSDFSKIIRKKREELGLKQEEFAKKIAEKESLIHKIEAGKVKPSISLALKLEKILKIRLIAELEGEESETAKPSNSEFTIGDIIKIKNRKK